MSEGEGGGENENRRAVRRFSFDLSTTTSPVAIHGANGDDGIHIRPNPAGRDLPGRY
ncbi:hypothetical protein [Streptosporangium sp. NPDC087985]|uniref:hypothetical protein n=1 Tax=Streptosporangium sp. NPDC087985 TaxID=3366196 RepID=UPI00382D4013